MTEKDEIYKYVWQCAFQRRWLYRGTPRELREHETILMCLKIAKWTVFDTEKPNYIKYNE